MTPSSSPTRPLIVALAAVSFASSYVTTDLVRMYERGPPSTASQFVALALVWLPIGLIAAAVYSGRNWGRWLILGFTAFGFWNMPWSIQEMKPLLLLQASLHTVASILLLLPSARTWFTSVRMLRKARSANAA
jgi:hypothetical protein